jgi:hypothetical protein
LEKFQVMGRPKRLQSPQSVFRFCRLDLSLSAASADVVAGALFLFSWQFQIFAIVKPLPQFGSIAPWTILLNSMLGMALLFLAGGIDRPTTRGGTGLGLAIAKQLASLWGAKSG